jgi:hypothetical protein
MNKLNIKAASLSVMHGHPLDRRGCYVDVTLHLSDDQIKNALHELISSLRFSEVEHMLRSEFPELFETA